MSEERRLGIGDVLIWARDSKANFYVAKDKSGKKALGCKIEGVKIVKDVIPLGIRDVIAKYQKELILLTEGRCPICEKILFAEDTDRFKRRYCKGSGPALYATTKDNEIHFLELINKRPGNFMGVFLEYKEDGVCDECGGELPTVHGKCEPCWQRLIGDGQDWSDEATIKFAGFPTKGILDRMRGLVATPQSLWQR